MRMFMRLLRLPVTALFVFGCISSTMAQSGESPIARSIAAQEKLLQKLPFTQLLSEVTDPVAQEKSLVEGVDTASFFRMEDNAIRALLTQRPKLLKLRFPAPRGGLLELQMQTADVFSEEFKIYAASNRNYPAQYEAGAFYWGVLDNQPGSLVAITITEEEVSGLIHRNGTTFNLGRVPGKNDGLHVLYQADDLKAPPTLGCSTNLEEHFVGTSEKDKVQGALEKSASNCVRMYVEVDHDIYLGKGGMTQAADYVTAVFNQVAILYANESINFTLHELVVWDVPDPYSGPSTSDYLNQFQNSLGSNYNGDLAHLVGYNGSGGIAYVDVLCAKSYGFGYSDINPSFATVPNYSWTVEVVTHEIGHNLGSPHTHDCAWNGNNTAIDGCGSSLGYGGCSGPLPSQEVGGTIMSYCHLIGNIGIKFANGFGPQPGDLIRSNVYNNNCLTACSEPSGYDAGITEIVSPQGTICADTETPIVEITNFGTQPLSIVMIEYQVDGVPYSFEWRGTLNSEASTPVSLPSLALSPGTHTFVASTGTLNGSQADENTINDSSSSQFTVNTEQEYFADTDGDGFGDPNSSIFTCNPPSGYVTDNTDCNDNDGDAYPGAPCGDGSICTIGEVMDANCNCSGTGPTGNEEAMGSFPTDPLTHNNSGSSSSTYNFEPGSKNAAFTVSGLDAQLSGNPRNRYEESVTITYIDGDGNPKDYGTFGGGSTASVEVSILEPILSVTVSLNDGYDGNAPTPLSVDLSTITYCGEAGAGCADDDDDGVCNEDDLCPGEDDLLDANNNGTPDCMESCDNPGFNFFDSDPLVHTQAGGSNEASLNYGGAIHSGISFTISGLSATTGGKPDNRFIEAVNVSYISADDKLVHKGTYTGENYSSVDISIMDAVKSISVTLFNAYEGSQVTGFEVDMSSVSSCIVTQGTASTTQGSDEVLLFPNPTGDYTLLRLTEAPEKAQIVVRNLLGAQVAAYEIEGIPAIRLNTAEWSDDGQVYLVTVYLPEGKPITKRLVVMR